MIGVVRNEEKAGRWLVVEYEGGDRRVASPVVTAKLAAMYGFGELRSYRLASEEEIHAQIESELDDPGIGSIEACPCGRFSRVEKR